MLQTHTLVSLTALGVYPPAMQGTAEKLEGSKLSKYRRQFPPVSEQFPALLEDTSAKQSTVSTYGKSILQNRLKSRHQQTSLQALSMARKRAFIGLSQNQWCLSCRQSRPCKRQGFTVCLCPGSAGETGKGVHRPAGVHSCWSVYPISTSSCVMGGRYRVFPHSMPIPLKKAVSFYTML